MIETHGRPSVWAGGLTLAVVAAICTSLVALTYGNTAPRIAANRQAYLEQSLEPVLAGISHDGKLSESAVTIFQPHELPGDHDVTVYRAFAGGQPVAALFVVTAPDGFTGPIRLLIGIADDGNITGVHVLEHRETPGLGDLIDATKSDWLKQFKGASIDDPDRADWAIRRDGGHFDQLTGASVTPRAVVRAIRETLLYFETHGDDLFTADADEEPATRP